MITTKEMQLVPIEKLIPYINNARTHSPEQIAKLRASLREFGFINPVMCARLVTELLRPLNLKDKCVLLTNSHK